MGLYIKLSVHISCGANTRKLQYSLFHKQRVLWDAWNYKFDVHYVNCHGKIVDFQQHQPLCMFGNQQDTIQCLKASSVYQDYSTQGAFLKW